MQVQSVNNNQPHFNGYVGKSVKKYINRAIQNECSKQFGNKTLNLEKTLELEEYGENILFKLSQYMTKTHKNTHLELGNTNHPSHPRIMNPISKHIMRIYSPLVETKPPHIDEFGTISMPKTMALKSKKEANLSDLEKLDQFCDKLGKIPQREIDKAFYNIEKNKVDALKNEKLGFFAVLRKTIKVIDLEDFFKQIYEQ